MLLNPGVRVFAASCGPHPLDGTLKQHVEKKRQTRHMIEVGMAEQDVERVSLNQFRQAKQPGSGIEHDAAIRKKVTARVTGLVGVVPGRSEAMQLHGAGRFPNR